MKDYGLVSVIIPTYNREATICRSVMSVLNQTYNNLEVLVVDDCSNDDTKTKIESIQDKRIRYIRLDCNQGACVARNKGIDVSKGEYIAFQDSDDEWLPDKLAVQLKLLTENDADVCFCRMKRHMDDKKTRISPKFEGNCFVSRRALYTHMYVSTQTILAKKKVFDEHRFDPLVKRTQDYDWTIRASKNYLFYYTEDILVIQYLQKDSLTYSGHRKSIEARRYFLEKYKEEIDDEAFVVFQLRVIARNRALLGEKPVEEFKSICSMRNTVQFRLALLLSKMGLMKYVYRIRGHYRASS